MKGSGKVQRERRLRTFGKGCSTLNGRGANPYVVYRGTGPEWYQPLVAGGGRVQCVGRLRAFGGDGGTLKGRGASPYAVYRGTGPKWYRPLVAGSGEVSVGERLWDLWKRTCVEALSMEGVQTLMWFVQGVVSF